MPTVYVVQRHAKYNEATGQMEDKFDLRPAEKFGELSFLLSPISLPKNPTTIIETLREKLVGFTDEDYLLLIGSPVFIAWTCAVASDINDGHVSVLQWNGKRQKYYAIKANNLVREE